MSDTDLSTRKLQGYLTVLHLSLPLLLGIFVNSF